MSYNHTTVGFDEFDSFKLNSQAWTWLEEEFGEPFIADYSDPDRKRRLRIAVFCDPSSHELMVAEEWLAVEDHDCDGTDVVKIAVYRLNHRPRLVKKFRN